MKRVIYNMASEPISTASFINPFHQPVCLYVYPLIVGRQRLDKNVTVATNTQETIEELLDAYMFMYKYTSACYVYAHVIICSIYVCMYEGV
jgi:hypothetical protein